jgi:hypothetical protein
MADDTKKVLIDTNLRKDPQQFSVLLLSPVGTVLQVHAAEIVKVGGNPSKDEILASGRKVTWVFVEATNGLFADLRKGYVHDTDLVSTQTTVEESPGFQAFHEQVDKVSFANACYLQATLNRTNPAYLYALAFALSGDQWSATQVKTDDPPDAVAVGVFRFTKEAWQFVLAEPEAAGLQVDQIKFPNAQCVVAAIVAAKAADLLQGLITDRPLSAVDLFLANLFADDKSFGSNATERIVQAATDNKDQPCAAVIAEIYPDPAARTAFFARNAGIFQANGSATLAQALNACATKLQAGFDKVTEAVQALEAEDDDDCQSSLLEDNVPSSPTGPVLEGTGAGGTGGGGAGGGGTGAGGAGAGGAIVQLQLDPAEHKTRNQPISQKLHDILEYAGRKTGIDVQVNSGGQPSSGPGHIGSHRHDFGGAADLYMIDATTRRVLNSDRPADQDRMAQFMQASVVAGATGIGHASGYMGPKSTHIGGGDPAVWGAGKTRAGAPGWVIDAFEHGRAHVLPDGQLATELARLRGAPPVVVGPIQQANPDDVPVLAAVRKRFSSEVQDPEIRRLIAASTNAEVGDQIQKAWHYYIETVFNRAAARDMTLKQTVTSDARQGGYYPKSTIDRLGDRVPPARQAQIDQIIANIMAGANESNFATGNESGSLRNGQVTRDMGPGKERFVREPHDKVWTARIMAAAARGDTNA